MLNDLQLTSHLHASTEVKLVTWCTLARNIVYLSLILTTGLAPSLPNALGE